MNPFTVLNIDKNATQKDIIRAVAVAMREKKYSAAEIAVAQKTLLNPVSRGCEEFLYNIDLSEYSDKLRLEIAREAARTGRAHEDDILDVESLTYLDVFH